MRDRQQMVGLKTDGRSGCQTNEKQRDERIDIQMEGQTDMWSDMHRRRDKKTDGGGK